MPNWCEGTIKFRGTRESIIDVMLNGLEPIYVGEGRVEFLEEESNENHLYFESDSGGEDLYMSGTHRHFIFDFGAIYAYRYGNDFIVVLPFRAAWAIIAHGEENFGCVDGGLDQFAKRFNVDIRASGFEQGMGFEQTVEVDRTGRIIIDYVNGYDDDYGKFVWECAMPNMGG